MAIPDIRQVTNSLRNIVRLNPEKRFILLSVSFPHLVRSSLSRVGIAKSSNAAAQLNPCIGLRSFQHSQHVHAKGYAPYSTVHEDSYESCSAVPSMQRTRAPAALTAHACGALHSLIALLALSFESEALIWHKPQSRRG